MKTKLYFALPLLFLLLFAQQSNAQCIAGFTHSVSGGTVTFTNTTIPSMYPLSSWDFGDGSPINNTFSPTHSYNAPGVYTVCLITVDSFSTCTDTFCAPVTVNVGCNNLSVAVTTTDMTNFTTCDGTATATVTGGTAPFSYTWSSFATTPSMINLCAGSYSVSVVDANGCYAGDYGNVYAPFQCTAGFGANVSGTSVQLYNTSNDTMNANFTWDFGDAASGNNINEYHTYAAAGTYTVTLVMYDSLYACTDTFTSPVTVGGPTSCSSYFSMVQDSFNLLQWYIYPSVTGQAPLTYLWDFGDATSSASPYPSHNYAAPGQYTICLTITDANLCSSYYCDSSSVQRMTAALQMQYATVINPLSVQELVTVTATIFPNPAGENLNIVLSKSSEGKICLADLTGKIVYEHTFSGQNVSVDVSGLAQGIYSCTITGASTNLNQKIVVIH